MRGLADAIDGQKPLDAEQKKALAKLQVQVSGVPVRLDGNAVLRILQRITSGQMSESQRAALEEVRFQVDDGGSPAEVTALEMVEAWRGFQQLRLSEQFLKQSSTLGYNPRYAYILLFILVMIVLWFGCNNAAKEIVKEEAIYARERAVNLHILPYLASKFVVLTAITVFHSVVLMAVVYGVLEVLARTLPGHSVPPPELMLAYPAQLGVVVLLSMTGVALGLLLSACVETPDRANALLPYVLIPQMILGGGILSVNRGLIQLLAWALSPVYWAYRAVHLGANQLPRDFPLYRPYEDGVGLPCLALALQTVALLVATAWFLKRKDG
jgi:hypothetical protein